jgi:hypothetical protein
MNKRDELFSNNLYATFTDCKLFTANMQSRKDKTIKRSGP